MLDGIYTNELIDSYYNAVKNIDAQQFVLEVHFDLNGYLSGEPYSMVVLLDQPLRLGNKERDSLF